MIQEENAIKARNILNGLKSRLAMPHDMEQELSEAMRLLVPECHLAPGDWVWHKNGKSLEMLVTHVGYNPLFCRFDVYCAAKEKGNTRLFNANELELAVRPPRKTVSSI